MNSKLIFSMIVLLLVLPMISGADWFNFDNYKEFDKDIGEYGRITIYDSSIFGEDKRLKEITLNKNSDVCSADCYAEKEIIMFEEGVLIEDVRFLRLQKDNSWSKGRVKSYQFYLIDGEKKTPYELGTEVNTGTYYVRLEAEKNPKHTIDWQIKTGSYSDFIEDWAVWLEGDFIDSWIAGADTINGITTFGENIWVSSDSGKDVSKYDLQGNFINSWDTNVSNADPFGITTNGTIIWVTNRDQVFRYDMDGNSIGNDSLNVGNDDARGIGTNDSFIWVTDDDDSIYKYDMQLNFINSFVAGTDRYRGVAFYNTFMYISNNQLPQVQMNYTNTSSRGIGNIELNVTNTDAQGITTDGSFLWVVNSATKRVFKYYSGLDDIRVVLGVPTNNSDSLDSLAFFNATIIPGQLFNITNSTIKIYNSLGILVNETTRIITGNRDNETNFSISNLNPGNLIWNIEGCVDDLTEVVCEFADNNKTLNYGVEQIFETFNSSVIETSNQNFILNLDILSGFNIQKASLIYNNTIFSGATITGSGINFNISRAITIPQGSQGFSSENRTFRFNVTLANDISGDTFHLLVGENTQKVNEIAFGFCNGLDLDVPMLNFTMVNEITNLEINASKNASTFQATFILGSDPDNLIKSFSFNNISENVSRFNFCTQEETNTFVVNMIAFFTANGFTDRDYFLTGAPLSNNTNEITLFLLPDSIGIEFFIDVEQDLFPLTGATINIDKFFVGEGVFRTTEIDVTDGDGRITSFLDLNKDYRFTIVKDGVLLDIQEKRAICDLTPCGLELSITGDTPDIYSGFSDTFAQQVLYNLSYNPTNKRVTFDFVDITGLATSFRMDIRKGLTNGTGTLISTQTLFTSSGSMTFNHTETQGDFTANILISRSPNQLIDFIKYIIADNSIVLGTLGLFVAFLIVITVIFGFSFSPPMLVMSVPLSLTLVKLMQIISVSNETIIVFYLLAIVAWGFMSR